MDLQTRLKLRPRSKDAQFDPLDSDSYFVPETRTPPLDAILAEPLKEAAVTDMNERIRNINASRNRQMQSGDYARRSRAHVSSVFEDMKDNADSELKFFQSVRRTQAAEFQAAALDGFERTFQDLNSGSKYMLPGQKMLERVTEEGNKNAERIDELTVSRSAPFMVNESSHELILIAEARLRQLMMQIGTCKPLGVPVGGDQWNSLIREAKARHLEHYVNLFTNNGTYTGKLTCTGPTHEAGECPHFFAVSLGIPAHGRETVHALAHRTERIASLQLDHRWGYATALRAWAAERNSQGVRPKSWKHCVDAQRLLHTFFSVSRDSVLGEPCLRLRCPRCAQQHRKTAPPTAPNDETTPPNAYEFRSSYIKSRVSLKE